MLLRPMLSTLAETLPTGPGWSYEVKWDGYRALAAVKPALVRLLEWQIGTRTDVDDYAHGHRG